MSDDIGQCVRDRLAATQSVKNIVKSNIFADALEQGEQPPAIVVQVPQSAPLEDLSGANRVWAAQVTVLAYGSDRAEANLLAKKVRDDALPANLQGTYHGMDIREVSLIAGPEELMDQPVDGSDRYRKLTRQVFSIWNNPV